LTGHSIALASFGVPQGQKAGSGAGSDLLTPFYYYSVLLTHIPIGTAESLTTLPSPNWL